MFKAEWVAFVQSCQELPGPHIVELRLEPMDSQETHEGNGHTLASIDAGLMPRILSASVLSRHGDTLVWLNARVDWVCGKA